jgi:hypothetical protein
MAVITDAQTSVRKLFRDLESHLRLRVRALSVTPDEKAAQPVEGRDGDLPHKFSSALLVRSLIKSGVPVENALEILPRVGEELVDRGLFNTTVDRSDLVRGVSAVLRGYEHDDADDWIREYQNRYGWEYEFQSPQKDAQQGQFVRIADYDGLSAAINSAVEELERGGLFGQGGDDGLIDHKLEIARLVRRTTRSVRASGLHTVSRRFIGDVAKEIAEWSVSVPKWTNSERSHFLDQAFDLLTVAARRVTDGAHSEAGDSIGEAIRLSSEVFAQAFGLWIALGDKDPRTIVSRLLISLGTARQVHHTAGQAGTTVGAPALFARLNAVGIPFDDLYRLLGRLAASMEILRRPISEEHQRLVDLREGLGYAETFKNWVAQLVADPIPCPVLDDYFAASDVVARQEVLDSIVGYVLDRSGVVEITRDRHTFAVDIDLRTAIADRGTGRAGWSKADGRPNS